jgi:dCMP deaminase
MKPWTMTGFMELMAKESTCTRGKVAAIIEREGRIIATGYNGSPSGMPHCIDVGCEVNSEGGCERTVHAEANAIAFAAKYGIATNGATMWCSMAPCYTCAKLMINAGINRVKYLTDYRDRRGVNLLREAGVEVDNLSAL